MERVLIGLIVGFTFSVFVFIVKSNYFTGWQKVVLGILIIFPPAQWGLALIFYFGNNVVANNPKIKTDTADFFDNFLPEKNTENKNSTNDVVEIEKSFPARDNDKSKNTTFKGIDPYAKNK